MNGEELDDVYPLIAPTPTESPNSATDNTGVQTSRQNRSPQSRSRPLVDNPWICTADEEEAEVSLANHPYYADNYQTPAASPSPRVTNNQHQNLHQEIQLLKTMIAQKENERKRKLSPKTPPAPEPAKSIPITSAETADMTKNEANQMLGSEHMAMELSTSDENQVPLELTANEDIEQISPVSAGESSDSYETSSDEEETEQDADHIEEEEDPVMREMEHRTKELKAQLADIQHRIKELDKDKAFEDTEKLKLKVRADLLRKRLGLTTISEPVTERRQSPTFDALDNNEDDKSDAMSLDSDYDGYEEKEFSKNRAKVGPAAYSNMPPYPPAPAFYQSPAFTVNAPPLLPPNPAFVSMPMPPAIVTPTRNIKRSPLTTKKEPNVPPRQQDIPLSQPTRGIPVPQVDTNDYPTSFTAEMNNLKNYFYDVQELIKIRFSNDKTVETAEEQAGARRTGRVSQLAYVDGMVISFDSVILHKKENDTGKEEGVSEDDQCLDSVLLRILRLKDKSQTIVDKDITSALSEVIKILPRDIEALITDPRHWGDTQLRDAKELLRKIAMAFPHVELLWTLFAELSLYCHGATEDFGKDVQFIFDKTPVFDVHWQTMRVMSVFPNWRPIRGDFMAKSRWSKSGDEDKEYERKSQIATEFLLRIMRYQGLRQVLKNLRAADDNYINENDVEPFSLEETQARVQLTDHDMYIIWMTVLYYYVCQKAPSMLCHHWFKEFVAKGEPSWSKPLFTIDWNAIASQRPLTRRERFGTVNILLSMLRFFTAKATRDETKRPYMVATWQTLLNFLANTDCYKRAGTLVLLRSGMKFTVLQPEILDTALTLQSAMGEHQQAIKTISNTIADCSLEKQLMIAYRAAYLLKLSNNSSQEELQQAANLLSIPLQSYFDFSAVILAPGEPQIDFVRRLYMGALGLDPVLAAPAKKNFTSFKFQSATFAWINLMFLTQISLWLYTNDTMQYIFRQQLKTTRNSALNALRSEDSKLLVSKYANACL